MSYPTVFHANIGNGFKIIEKLMPKIAATCCVEMLGGLQRVLDITVQFVKEREQFGQPIGSFQTIQNYCADIAIDLEASMAKAWCGDAYRRATEVAMQAHGAMGFTEEYDLQFYYKQAKMMQLMYGGSSYHRNIVANELGL